MMLLPASKLFAFFAQVNFDPREIQKDFLTTAWIVAYLDDATIAFRRETAYQLVRSCTSCGLRRAGNWSSFQ